MDRSKLLIMSFWLAIRMLLLLFYRRAVTSLQKKNMYLGHFYGARIALFYIMILRFVFWVNHHRLVKMVVPAHASSPEGVVLLELSFSAGLDSTTEFDKAVSL